MCPFEVVEPEGPGQAVEHVVRDAGAAPSFQPDVVVDRDAGERRDLLATETGNPARRETLGEVDVTRGQTGPLGLQEVAQLFRSFHASTVGRRIGARQGLVVPL